MYIKRTFLAALVAMGCMTASAQEQKTEYEFNPHWYLQLQVGAQETLGEVSAKHLFSPNAQVAAGYQFDKIWGARLAINAWQSKGGWDFHRFDVNPLTGQVASAVTPYHWKWNYVAPTVDITANLTNLFGGYNPMRPVSFSLFAGIGMNIAFNNDEACDVYGQVYNLIGGNQNMDLTWDGTRVRFLSQFGGMLDVRVSDRVSLGLEVGANLLSDAYNSKHAGNCDWYFNALAGVKINLGKTYKKKVVEAPAEPEPRVVERIVEKIVEKPVPVPDEKVEPLRRDIFFVIRGTQISAAEMQKVRDIAEYMVKYPKSKVQITGYADKGTGNPTINRNLSMKRAAVVAKTLSQQFGIQDYRISTDFKGDTEQPFAEQVKNRVSICVAAE
jgi:outer membrane protein OmpA-like peptidoglycan-associated protein